tara:strand:- start:210 stop:524 length:315 start_codon:yes stop_codon:yes gene_type:complete
MKKNINFSWTSKKPIHGLRHFVLINKINNNSQTVFELVSVIDAEISVEVSESELTNQNKWHTGWLDLSKMESITKNYFEFKLTEKNQKKIKKVFLNEDSLFNIS